MKLYLTIVAAYLTGRAIVGAVKADAEVRAFYRAVDLCWPRPTRLEDSEATRETGA